jgi:hypothetical protein
METLTLPTPLAGGATVPACRPCVYVDGRRRRGLQVSQWSSLPAPDFGIASLVPARPGRVSPDTLIRALPPIGAKVRIVTGRWFNTTVFDGVVTSHTTSLGDNGDLPTAHVIHSLAHDMQEPVVVRRHRHEGHWQPVTTGGLEFNGADESLASREWFPAGGRRSPAFESQSANGQPWTVGDALGYLLADLPSHVATPSRAELQALGGGHVLPHVDLAGKSLGQSLMTVANHGGLAIRPARDQRGIVVYRPGVDGAVRRLRLQQAGESLTVGESNVYQGHLTLSPRPGVPTVRACGSYKQFEVTVELQPGWDRSLETDDWRTFVRSANPDWPEVASVYRKWVLNEHGRYCDAPWNLSHQSLIGLGAGEFVRDVARRFEPCLSADSSGQSMGVFVEIFTTAGQWRSWHGPVRISDSECSIYLDGDGLPADYFQMAIDGDARLRVTATITSDERLSVTVPGTPGVPAVVLDYSASAHWRQVHLTSVLTSCRGTQPLGECDDLAMLSARARRHRLDQSGGVEGIVTLGWLCPWVQVGDRISEVAGRGIDLMGATEAMSAVTEVVHDVDAQTTQLTIRG